MSAGEWQIIDELKETNKLLTEIRDILKRHLVPDESVYK